VSPAAPRRRGFRVVAVSLYDDQWTALERVVANLEADGYRKPGRSMVIQEAIEVLVAAIGKGSAGEFFRGRARQKLSVEFYRERAPRKRASGGRRG
jgi:hypothetical protein